MISKSMQLHINQYRARNNNNNNNKEMNKKKRADHRFVIWVLRSHDDRNMHSTSRYNNEIEYVSAKKSTESLSSIQIGEHLWYTEHFRDYIIWLQCTWSLALFCPSHIKPWRWMKWNELNLTECSPKYTLYQACKNSNRCVNQHHVQFRLHTNCTPSKKQCAVWPRSRWIAHFHSGRIFSSLCFMQASIQIDDFIYIGPEIRFVCSARVRVTYSTSINI